MDGFSLIDVPFSKNFFPFTLTRSVADIRCGILTIREKWHHYLSKHVASERMIAVPANVLPDPALVTSLLNGDAVKFENCIQLKELTDILRLHPEEMKNDYWMITSGRSSIPVSSTNSISGSDIFIEAGAVVEHCHLNATDGPVYIGKDALVMEGCMIRGPFALGEKAVVKMGTKIYGATSAGPHSVLGGEIKNSIVFGYSNKSHDGFLGDSVIGEWCNIGGGSSNSNIKNSAGEVRLWNPFTRTHLNAGLKCGLMMGDYSRAAINTSFNTGTIVGACCHVFGNGFTPAYLPSFSWGYNSEVYDFEKAIEHISRWKQLKGGQLTSQETDNLKLIFDQQKELL